MAEVRLPAPVKATVDGRLDEGSWNEGTTFAPGAFAIDDNKRLWYVCPCGCGHIGMLYVQAPGAGQPVDKGPVWQWDGNREAPTISPSINHIGHWHGWLQGGMFVQA